MRHVASSAASERASLGVQTQALTRGSPFFLLQQERHLGPDGADPPRRDGAEERGREHDAAAEVVPGKVRLASYHNKMTMSFSFTEEN